MTIELIQHPTTQQMFVAVVRQPQTIIFACPLQPFELKYKNTAIELRQHFNNCFDKHTHGIYWGNALTDAIADSEREDEWRGLDYV